MKIVDKNLTPQKIVWAPVAGKSQRSLLAVAPLCPATLKPLSVSQFKSIYLSVCPPTVSWFTETDQNGLTKNTETDFEEYRNGLK